MIQRQLVQFKVCLFGAHIWMLRETANHHCLNERTQNWHVHAQTTTTTEVNRFKLHPICRDTFFVFMSRIKKKALSKKRRRTQASYPSSISNLALHKYRLENCSDNHLFATGSKNIWAVRVKVKLSSEADVKQLFPCVTLKVSEKKKRHFDRWNSSSCQLNSGAAVSFGWIRTLGWNCIDQETGNICSL